MEIIQNQTFTGETMIIDDKFFVNCVLENCVLIYAGGDIRFDGSKAKNCAWNFEGPANRTINLLKWLKALPADFITPPPSPRQ